jgi:acetyl-CoA synthetase
MRESLDIELKDELTWHPTAEIIAQSNSKRLMDRLGVETYDEFIKFSTTQTDQFWRAVIDDLGISFFNDYHSTLDISKGIPWARWFVGGTLNIAYNCVDKHIATLRDKIAVLCEREDGVVRSRTYGELFFEMNRLCCALKQLGVQKGDTVALYLPMIPEAVVAFLAVAKIGAIVIPLFSGYASGALASRIHDSGAKVLIAADRYQRKGSVINMQKIAAEVCSQVPELEHIIIVENSGKDICLGEKEILWSTLTHSQSDIYPCEQTDAEDPFLVIYTSGTTGSPKGAVHVHGGFTVNIAKEVAYHMDMHSHDVLHWVADLGWIMGPWEIIGCLTLGGTLLLNEGAPLYRDGEHLLSMIERHRVSLFGVSPTLIRSLRQSISTVPQKFDTSSLRVIGSTGEPMDMQSYAWCYREIGKRTCPIINISGGTEVGACFLAPLPIESIKPCSLQGPALGMDIAVFDEAGVPLYSKVGELVCRKPWPGMTRGLWRDPERYIEKYWSRFQNVWVHGDFARIDEDGHWFLLGRSDDTIIIAGKCISPSEIESILNAHPCVIESAAVGIADALKGELVWCFVVLKDSAQSSHDHIRHELMVCVDSDLGRPFMPHAIFFVDELPKTRSAKILRRTIRSLIQGQEHGDLSSIENPLALQNIQHALQSQCRY